MARRGVSWRGVVWQSDDKMKTLSDALNHMMGINRDKLKIGCESVMHACV
jgi:hypothetical protein